MFKIWTWITNIENWIINFLKRKNISEKTINIVLAIFYTLIFFIWVTLFILLIWIFFLALTIILEFIWIWLFWPMLLITQWFSWIVLISMLIMYWIVSFFFYKIMSKSINEEKEKE